MVKRVTIAVLGFMAIGFLIFPPLWILLVVTTTTSSTIPDFRRGFREEFLGPLASVPNWAFSIPILLGVCLLVWFAHWLGPARGR